MTVFLINADHLKAQLDAYDQFEQMLGKANTNSAFFKAMVERLQASPDCTVKEVRVLDTEYSQVIGRRHRFRLRHAFVATGSTCVQLADSIQVQAQVLNFQRNDGGEDPDWFELDRDSIQRLES